MPLSVSGEVPDPQRSALAPTLLREIRIPFLALSLLAP
jgi:hypothetical protein